MSNTQVLERPQATGFDDTIGIIRRYPSVFHNRLEQTERPAGVDATTQGVSVYGSDIVKWIKNNHQSLRLLVIGKSISRDVILSPACNESISFDMNGMSYKIPLQEDFSILAEARGSLACLYLPVDCSRLGMETVSGKKLDEDFFVNINLGEGSYLTARAGIRLLEWVEYLMRDIEKPLWSADLKPAR